MRTIRNSALLASLAFLLAAGASHAAPGCGKSSSPAIVQLRVTQPLILTPDGDVSFKVQLQADGCVTVHYPSYDQRAGTYRYALGPAEFDRLRQQVKASGIEEFNPEAVRAELEQLAAAKNAGAGPSVIHRVSDEEVIELSIEGQTTPKTGAGSPALVWSGLREQLLNHPQHSRLLALRSLTDRLTQLGSDPRMSKVQAQ